MQKRSLGLWDVLIALSLIGIAAIVYSLGRQERFYGDAALLLHNYARDRALYHPLHHAFVTLFTSAGADLLLALRLASSVPSVLAVGVLFAALRRMGASQFAATFATLMAACASSSYFFSTTIEVHALQMLLVALALFFLSGLPKSSLGLSLISAGTAAVCLAGSHPTSILALPGLGLIFWSRMRKGGVESRVLVRVFAVLALTSLLAGALVMRNYMAYKGIDLAELYDWAKWDLSLAPGRNLPIPIVFLENQFVRPLFLLPVLAAVALMFDLFRDRLRAGSILLWVGGQAVILAGAPFNERGAYFLTTAPALAWAVAIGIDTFLTKVRNRPVRSVFLLLAVTALWLQFAVARYKTSLYDTELTQEERAWVEGFHALSGTKAVFLTISARHMDLAETYVPVPTDNSRQYLELPEAELNAAIENYVGWAKDATAGGYPLYVDQLLFDFAPQHAALEKSLQRMGQDFDFEPVQSGPFKAQRARLK